MSEREILLSVSNLKVTFDVYPSGAMPWTKPRKLKAVDGVDFDLFSGETLGIVGESGCGKSTLARAVARMVPASAGEVLWLGKDLLGMGARDLKAVRSDVQFIFQDPLASLNPRMTVGQIISEPLRTHHPDLSRDDVKARVKDMMEKDGLLQNKINR